MPNDPMERMLSFIKEIGLEYAFETIKGDTFLPGLEFRNGTLIIDTNKLRYPGDILHEAGHLACMPPDIRKTMSGNLDNNNMNQGGELMAIAWSYAACRHLQIDPAFVFHEHGYKGAGDNIVTNFNEGRYFGVPLLQWCGMSYDVPTAQKLDVPPYPEMCRWTCEKNMFII
jgi:hypothetical protein